MTVALSADVFANDKLETDALASGSEQSEPVTTHLGPIFTVDWQLRVAAPRLRELTIYAVDRYRTPYDRGGRRVEESSGNYLDAGIRTVSPLSPAVGLLSAVNVRHQTGLKSNSTIATAATARVGVTLGVVHSFPGGLSFQPFVRGDHSKIKSVDSSASATGIAAGVALGRRF